MAGKARFLRIAIVFLAIGLSPRVIFAAGEEVACRAVFDRSALDSHEFVHDEGVESSDVGLVQAQVRLLDGFLGRLRPSKIRVSVENRRVNASELTFDSVLHIGTKSAPGAEDRKRPERMKVVLSHEYGHAVFSEHFRPLLAARGEKVTRALEPFIHFNELFADIVAVMAAENPKAMADALLIPEEGPWSERRPDSGNGGRPRDFTALTQFKDWRGDRGGDGNYTYLDPVRAVLWNLYLSRLAKSNRELFLTVYLRSVDEHSAERKRQEASGRFFSPMQVNQEFLQVFVRQARAAGLEMNKDTSKPDFYDRLKEQLKRPVKLSVETIGKFTPEEKADATAQIEAAMRFAQKNFPLAREGSVLLSDKDKREPFATQWHLSVAYRFKSSINGEEKFKSAEESRVLLYQGVGLSVFDQNFGSYEIWEQRYQDGIGTLTRMGRRATAPHGSVLQMVFKGYTVLFSDIFAVAMTQNLSAVSRMLTFEGMPERDKEAAAARDFLSVIDLTTWRESSIRNRLSPVRSFLGHNPAAINLLKNDPARFVALSFDVITAELTALSQELAGDVGNMSIPTLNERLIERFKAKLAHE